jgi:protein-ribulosamine 3-kinase
VRGPPNDVRTAVELALGTTTGRACTIAEVTRVGGGCISPSARVLADSGATFFLKWSDGDAPRSLFSAEARGLAQLAASGAVRVPAVIAFDEEWLLLEWLEPGPALEGTWSRLGQELAAVHRVRAHAFGDNADNFIGPLPQSNAESDNWPAFWRARRITPQLVRAQQAFARQDVTRLEHFLETLEDLLAPGDEDGASLLHGDLWSGNVYITDGGQAALVDPSAYYGHREVDLAMAALFGGFDRSFFEAYDAEWSLQPGWEERRAAYQLYYLLVHVNLFGAGYVSSTLAALEAAGG